MKPNFRWCTICGTKFWNTGEFICSECIKDINLRKKEAKKKEAKKKKMLQARETPNDVWIRRWQVQGTSGKEYTVALKNDNTYGCSCPAWKFQKANSGARNPCQHILRILLEQKLERGEQDANRMSREVLKIVKEPTPHPSEKKPTAVRSIRFEE